MTEIPFFRLQIALIHFIGINFQGNPFIKDNGSILKRFKFIRIVGQQVDRFDP